MPYIVKQICKIDIPSSSYRVHKYYVQVYVNQGGSILNLVIIVVPVSVGRIERDIREPFSYRSNPQLIAAEQKHRIMQRDSDVEVILTQ